MTAGASTPDWIIGEVIGVMCDDVKSIENEVNGEVENEITTTETNAEIKYSTKLQKSMRQLPRLRKTKKQALLSCRRKKL